MNKILVATLLVAFSHTSWCKEVASRAAHILGPSAVFSCGKYLDTRKNDAVNSSLAGRQVASWLEGYLSGYNSFSNSPRIDIPDEETLIAYADKHCRDKPLSNLPSAALALIEEIVNNQ